MSKSVKTLLLLSLGSSLSSLAFSQAPTIRKVLDRANKAEPSLQITVREVDLFGVSGETLLQAQRHAESIFRKAGIEIRWIKLHALAQQRPV